MKRQGALLVSAALLLAACDNPANEIPEPTAQPEETTEGSFHSDNADEILAAVQESLDSVRENVEVSDSAKERIMGPALRSIQGETRVASRTGDEKFLTTVTTDGANSTWGAAGQYPRVAMAFANEPDGENAAQLLVLVQTRGQSNFRLWGYAHLFSSDNSYEFDSSTTSVDANDGKGLVASPVEVGDDYVNRLNNRESEFSFTDDPLSTSLEEQRSSLAESVEGTGEYSLEPVRETDQGPISISTEDGGAVSMSVYSYDMVITRTVAGSTITVGEPLATMVGADEGTYDVQGKLRAHYQVMVAFYIPPEGSKEDIVVLGASAPSLFLVEDDASANPDEGANDTEEVEE